MSGLYLPGMEMPTHCIDCPFMVSRDGDDCILQSAEANESFENWEQMRAGCPLIPVPDHGRLIDADKLKQELRTAGIVDTYGSQVLIKIDNATTIIPASEEAGE